MTGPVILYATGDVAPRREDLPSMFAGVAPLLRTGDIVFGQLETCVSDRGSAAPNARLAMRTDPTAAAVIRDAGYSVMSFAGNHCFDWGRDAFFDTLSHVSSTGIALCGAGENLAAARVPAIIDARGASVAVLAYSSILPTGYWAEATRPGCAPMRAHTVYEQIEHDQPGTPARVHTFAHQGDLRALIDDVRRAKQKADVVAISIHWGIHFVPAEIAGYQREVAHAAIDAGADIILGHHPHILKGVEIYKGAAIFYSLGNFAIEMPWAFDENIRSAESFKDLIALNPAFSASAFPPDTFRTLIVKATIENGRISEIAFVPAHIDDDAVPHVLSPDDPRFAGLVDYMTTISRSQGIDSLYTVRGGEVVVSKP